MTITLTREEAQQVLDDLEALTAYIQGIDKGIVLKTQSIKTFRTRLSAPEPAPVAWLFQHEETGLTDCIDTQQVEWGFEKNNLRWQKIAPLYIAPPQREEGCAECGKKSSDGWALYCVNCSERKWQGLTGEELQEIYQSAGTVHFKFAMVETLLKRKNT
jgi:hypothetical protein